MRLSSLFRSRRVPPEVAAAARARVAALGAPERPAVPRATPSEEPGPVPVRDAPPWPSSAAAGPAEAGPAAGPAEAGPAAAPAGPESPRVATEQPAVQLPGGDPTHAGGAALRAGLADLLPPSIRGGRIAVDARAAVAIALLGAVAVLLGATYLWRARPGSTALPPVTVSRADTSAPSSAGAEVVVDVQGVVRRPGVVRLPAGSRVIDAVRAAGGPAPGAATASLNLARILTDGEQVVVTKVGAAPGPGSGQPAGSGAGPAGGAAAGGGAAVPPYQALLDLNSATVDQLDDLPGVGPVLAQRIVDWRTEHGRFTSVEELREVNGIGERRFGDLKGRVRV